MTTPVHNEKLTKYTTLLELALAQVNAIDAHDPKMLNLIMERKWAIIRSLSGTRELMKSEPDLAAIIHQIQEADQLAERKLTGKMTHVRTRLYQMNKQNTARQVYAQTSRKKHPILGLEIDNNTPRYFDIQS